MLFLTGKKEKKGTVWDICCRRSKTERAVEIRFHLWSSSRSNKCFQSSITMGNGFSIWSLDGNRNRISLKLCFKPVRRKKWCCFFLIRSLLRILLINLQDFLSRHILICWTIFLRFLLWLSFACSIKKPSRTDCPDFLIVWKVSYDCPK